jgi:methylated-DNA-protein-cysteine methyltransferase-like protein
VSDNVTPFEAAVIAVLVATEPGDVMSYGEVAAEAGFPGAARAVGGVLRRVDDLPWWRIVAANGRVIPHNPTEHIERLRAEGVAVENGRVVQVSPEMNSRIVPGRVRRRQ